MGIRLRYDPRIEGSGGWGVQWGGATPGGFNAGKFGTLAIWVKGAEGDEAFQVSVKDRLGQEAWVQARSMLAVSERWQTLRIPLADLKVDASQIENLNIGFNREHGPGEVCIDEIAFEGEPAAAPPPFRPRP